MMRDHCPREFLTANWRLCSDAEQSAEKHNDADGNKDRIGALVLIHVLHHQQHGYGYRRNQQQHHVDGVQVETTCSNDVIIAYIAMNMAMALRPS